MTKLILIALLLAGAAQAQVTQRVSWTASVATNNNAVDGYRLDAAWTNWPGPLTVTNWQPVATFSGTATNGIWTNATPNTIYVFRLLATNSVGVSLPSNLSTNTTPALPPQPLNLKITFNVQYSTNLITGWLAGGVVTIVVPASQFPGVTADTAGLFVRLSQNATSVAAQ